jgi:hypothetical protein
MRQINRLWYFEEKTQCTFKILKIHKWGITNLSCFKTHQVMLVFKLQHVFCPLLGLDEMLTKSNEKKIWIIIFWNILSIGKMVMYLKIAWFFCKMMDKLKSLDEKPMKNITYVCYIITSNFSIIYIFMMIGFCAWMFQVSKHPSTPSLIIVPL